jgi:hypothetical protein
MMVEAGFVSTERARVDSIARDDVFVRPATSICSSTSRAGRTRTSLVGQHHHGPSISRVLRPGTQPPVASITDMNGAPPERAARHRLDARAAHTNRQVRFYCHDNTATASPSMKVATRLDTSSASHPFDLCRDDARDDLSIHRRPQRIDSAHGGQTPVGMWRRAGRLAFW